MSVELVTQSDIPEVLELIAQAVRHSVVGNEEDARFILSDIKSVLDELASKSIEAVHLKYVTEGRIGGVVLVKKYWNLSNLFVLPALQRRGIGRTMLETALAACREKSPKGKVMVNSSGVAVAFYKAMGFVQTGPGVDRPGGCVPLEYSFTPGV